MAGKPLMLIICIKYNIFTQLTLFPKHTIFASSFSCLFFFQRMNVWNHDYSLLLDRNGPHSNLAHENLWKQRPWVQGENCDRSMCLRDGKHAYAQWWHFMIQWKRCPVHTAARLWWWPQPATPHHSCARGTRLSHPLCSLRGDMKGNFKSRKINESLNKYKVP